MAASCAGRFERKAPTRGNQSIHPVQHQPSRFHRRAVRIEWGDAAGDFVGVDELCHMKPRGQEIRRRGGFPRTIWSADDNGLFRCHGPARSTPLSRQIRHHRVEHREAFRRDAQAAIAAAFDEAFLRKELDAFGIERLAGERSIARRIDAFSEA
jgi:hypothetical protein